jgi:hypothetical protein
MIVYEHDKPGLGEGPGETFEPMFLHTCIAMRHRDGRMPGRPILRHEEPPAGPVTALDLEFHVAPLDQTTAWSLSHPPPQCQFKRQQQAGSRSFPARSLY